jgi:chaperonin GroEL (HSP60 family)
MTFTKVLDKRPYLQRLQQSVDKLDGVIGADHVAYMHGRSSLVTDKVVTSLRYAKETEGIPGIIEGMILEACYKAEIASAGSASLCASFSLALIEKIIEKCEAGYTFKEVRQEAIGAHRSFYGALNALAADPTLETLKMAVRDAVGDKMLGEMVLAAVELAGVDGTVIPEPTQTVVPSIELVHGYRFAINPPRSFYDGTGKWEKAYPKVLVIDGVIERVSEIHGILEKAATTKQPIVIITRGYGDEVLSTLKMNHDRRTLNIIPIIVPFDLDGINMINDISIVCGADIVTSLKGSVISAVRFDDLKTVESITCHGKTMTVINKKTEVAIRNHVQFLSDKQQKQHIEDVSDLLLKRIRALASMCVRLRVASKTEPQKLKDLEAVDVGLRIVKSVMGHGVVDTSSIEGDGTIFGDAWDKTKESYGTMPLMSVLSAVHHGLSIAAMACSVEKAIVVEL